MNKSTNEASVLHIFRLYGWLHLVPLLFLPLLRFLPVHQEVSLMDILQPSFAGLDRLTVIHNQRAAILFSGIQTLVLLGYLYWPLPKRKLGKWYLPSGLIFATAGLIIEQRLFFPSMAAFQILPFFFIILLILTAWQYGFKAVIAFTAGTILLDGLLNLLFPQTVFFISRSSSSTTVIALALEVWYGQAFVRSVTFLVLGYITSRLAATQMQQSQRLAEANQKMVRHAATLEQLATSRERVRLSRELHDTAAHTLSALAVEIEALLTISADMPEKAQEILNQMQQTTQEGLGETRRAMQALRAAPLEELGLVEALRLLAEDFAARNRLKLDLALPETVENVPGEVEQAFYRVTQEALENVARHAHARRLELRMSQYNGTLELNVADDGTGFQPEEETTARRLGLTGMHERAEMIGAKLSVESQPGQGTTVRMKMERRL